MALLLAACSAADPSSGSAAPETVGATDTQPPVQPTVTTETTVPPTTLPPIPGSAALGARLDELAADGDFSGVVLIGASERIAFEFTAGLADRELHIPVDEGTRFNLGSMSKMFTAVAIMQLVEQGAIALHGTIADYLPDYPNPEVAELVTIEQLLTHTSGLGDAFTAEFEAHPNDFRDDSDYLPLFADDPLLFPPGEQFAYSNAGYVVLGLIIEQVSNERYLDHVRSHVFGPAGMQDTDSFDIDGNAPDIAVGYTTRDLHGDDTGTLAANTQLMPGRGFAAGGGYSTARDLFSFRNALLGGRLLTGESVDLLTTGRVDVGEGSRYALGFFDRIQAGERVVGHGGGAPGVCSSLSIYPETGYTVVVLSNSDADCLAVLDFFATDPPG